MWKLKEKVVGSRNGIIHVNDDVEHMYFGGWILISSTP